MPSDEIHWEREGSPLPPNSTITHGVLHIPNITLNDEGTYKCVAKQGELETETEFRLQVDDFVPIFYGSDSVEFSPLEEEKIENLNIQLTVKPESPNGVLFATEKRGEVSPDRYKATAQGDRSPPVNQHLARLKDGQVVYEYDFGLGRDELVLPMRLPMNEWSTVEVKNEAHQATVTVNGAVTVSKDHPIPFPFPGKNKPLFIGRQSDEDQIRRPLPGLKGVISEVIVSGQNIPIARGYSTPGVKPYDACKNNPCANQGRCRKANRARGYTCVCQPPFGGYQCETLPFKCKEESCNTGICVDKGETWQCVCPANTSGIRCERPAHPQLKKSFAFLNKTSFLAVQPPATLDEMKVSLRLRPQHLRGDRILLYTASQHGSAPPAHISLSMKEGRLVYTQHHGPEKQELESVEIRPDDVAHGVDVLVWRDSNGVSLVVNGKNASLKNTVASFSPSTDMYIGGFPPAFAAAEGVPHSAFTGCIENVVINTKEVDLSTQIAPSSGDLISCDEIPFTFEGFSSLDIATEGTEPADEDEIASDEIPPTTEETEELVAFTLVDDNLMEIIEIPTTGWSSPETGPEDVEREETTTTEEPTMATTSSTTTSSTTSTTPEPVTEEITEEPETEPPTTIEEPTTTTEEPTTTIEQPENFYNTIKDLDELKEPSITTSETDPDGWGVENVTPCTDSSCFVSPAPDVCLNHDCSANGRCEAYNATHYECVCNLFYDGPRCGVFKPIEHAAHFNGDAFIEISADELPHLSSEKEESIQLRFKTTAPNGLLLWQGQQAGVPIAGEDYSSLSITNGYLHYSYELGGGAAHLVSPVRVADGKQHVVRLERRGRRGSLFLDDSDEIKGLSSGILAMLNVDGNIFIGGVPNIEDNTGGLHEYNFVGCIADVRMNGEKLDLMGTAVDGKNVRPCEEWLEPKRFLRYLKKRRKTV